MVMPESRHVSRRVLAGATLALVGGGFMLREHGSQDAPAGAASGAPSTTTPAVATPTPSPTPTIPKVDTAALTAELDAYRAKRGGVQGLAVRDLRNLKTFEWQPFTNETLSTIKVLILVSVLRKCHETGESLTEQQHTYARRMIQRSDNAATDSLLEWVGTEHVAESAQLLGLTNTTVRGGGAAGTANWWGYSTTNPGDWVTLLGAVHAAPITRTTAGQPIIDDGDRYYIRDLMSGVISSQRWGVADRPLPGEVSAETKNGWGPMADGYRLNSIGHVFGDRRDYHMAILTRSPRGFAYGRETINGLARIVHKALVHEL